MLFLYLIIAAVLLSTYRRPIAVFSIWFIAVFYLPVIFAIMYCTCIQVTLINAINDAGMSLGENVTGTPVTSLHL